MVFTLRGEADMISTCLDECCNRQDVIEFFWTLTEEELGFGVKSKYAHITLITLSATKFEKITHLLSKRQIYVGDFFKIL